MARQGCFGDSNLGRQYYTQGKTDFFKWHLREKISLENLQDYYCLLLRHTFPPKAAHQGDCKAKGLYDESHELSNLRYMSSATRSKTH